MDNATQKKPEFSTMDIYLSAYLTMVKGLDYRLKASDRGKVMFLFDLDKNTAFECIDEFNNRGTTVSLSAYVHEVKHLRGKMNDYRNPINY
jgi:hypothetical protein